MNMMTKPLNKICNGCTGEFKFDSPIDYANRSFLISPCPTCLQDYCRSCMNEHYSLCSSKRNNSVNNQQ